MGKGVETTSKGQRTRNKNVVNFVSFMFRKKRNSQENGNSIHEANIRSHCQGKIAYPIFPRKDQFMGTQSN